MTSDECRKISNFSDRTSGMPVSWNPTITLLQKKREGSLNLEHPNALNTDDSKNTEQTRTETDNHTCDLEERKMEEVTKKASIDSQTNIKPNCSLAKEEAGVSSSPLAGERHVKIKNNQENVLQVKENSDGIDKKDSELDMKRKADKATLKPWSPPDASYRLKRYQNNPMKIENYEPGMSSVVLLDPFVNNLHNPPIEKPGEFCKYTEQKPDSKYQIRKTNGKVSPLLAESTVHSLYRQVQKGGDIPLEGLRCPIPPVKAHSSRLVLKEQHKKKLQSLESQSSQTNVDSQQRTNDSWSFSLTINRPQSALSSPMCNSVHESRRSKDELSAVRKRELEILIAEAKQKRLFEEMEANKARRHSDNFHSHVKSPVDLDRYDLDDNIFQASGSVSTSPLFVRHPMKARALFSFKAKMAKELSLNKGDTVYILRQIDRNWFEGQRHGSVGIFPVNYVEVLDDYYEFSQGDGDNLFVAKYDFEAQDPMELPFRKGDVLRLIQDVDHNWYEASLGSRSGLVPKAYVEPLHNRLYTPLNLTSMTSYLDSPQHDSPGAMSSASSCLSSGVDPLSNGRHPQYSQCTDGSASKTRSKVNSLRSEMDNSMSDETQRNWSQIEPDKNFRARSNSLNAMEMTAKSSNLNQFSGTQNADSCEPYGWEDTENFREMRYDWRQNEPELSNTYVYVPENRFGTKQQHIEHNDFFPYMVCQANFAYVPQDEDELELLPGDIIYVTEMFDDGWFVGISQRTNTYGTFPGNYVQKMRLRQLESCTL